MRYIIFSFLCALSWKNIGAQSLIASRGCVGMYGNAGITNNGAWYLSSIQNTCSDYVLIESSEYRVKFQGFDRDGDTKFRTRKIKFPDVFLAPNTQIVKDKSRSDNGSLTYTQVRWQQGELGNAWIGKPGVPVDGAIKVSENSETYIGSKNEVEFYLSLKSSTQNWEGYTYKIYKVSMIAKNKSGSKQTPEARITYDVYFHGQPYSGDLELKNIKGYETKTKQEKEKCLFNFVPEIYINIKSSNLSVNGGITSKTTESSSASDGSESTSSNSNSTASNAEESTSASTTPSSSTASNNTNANSQSSASTSSNTSSTYAGLAVAISSEVKAGSPQESIQKGLEKLDEKKYDDAYSYFSKAKTLDKQKGPEYYQAEYLCALAKNKRGDELFVQEQYQSAETHYKAAVTHIKGAAMLTQFKDGIDQSDYDNNLALYETNANKWVELKEKQAKEKQANESLFNELMAEGKAASEKEDYTTAIDKFELASKLNVNNTSAIQYLNTAKEKQELQIAKAQKEAELKIKLEQERLAKEKAEAEKKATFDSHIAKGDEFMKVEQVDNAISAYESALLVGFDNTLAVEKITKAKEFNSKKLTYDTRFSEIPNYHGTSYKTVNINGTEWFVQNLSTAKNRNGEDLSQVEKPKEFDNSSLMGKAMDFAQSKGIGKKETEDVTQRSIFMKQDNNYLYNLFAVQKDQLCPEGWNVANITDWRILIINMGGAVTEETENESWKKSTYKIPNKYALSYHESVSESIQKDMSGFGLLTSAHVEQGKYVYGIEAKYWAYDDAGRHLISIDMPDKTNLDHSIVTITSFKDDYYLGGSAYSCKCVKD